MTSQTPVEMVTAFLDDLARGELDRALEQVDDDIVYTNVSLPTVHGKRRMAKVFAPMAKPSFGFNYRMVHVAADDEIVITERVDELRLGPIVLQFWVFGRFEIREGRIAVWRDYFDYFDITKALVRGLAAVIVTSLQKPLPAPPPATD